MQEAIEKVGELEAALMKLRKETETFISMQGAVNVGSVDALSISHKLHDLEVKAHEAWKELTETAGGE